MTNLAAQIWALLAGLVAMTLIGLALLFIGKPPDESGPRVFLLGWGSGIAVGYLTYLRVSRRRSENPPGTQDE